MDCMDCDPSLAYNDAAHRGDIEAEAEAEVEAHVEHHWL